MRKFAMMWVFIALLGKAVQAMAWIVFDPTNWAQNIITATQSVHAETQRALQYAVQLQQLQAQMRNLAQLPNAGVLIRDFTPDVNNANTYVSTLRALYGDLTGLSTTVQQQFREQAASNLPWDQYVQREVLFAQRQQNTAQFGFGAVQGAMQRVNDDYAQMRDAQSRISTADGAQAQMQLMNQQLNQLVSMNRDILTGISAMVQNMSEKSAADAAKQQSNLGTMTEEQIQRAKDAAAAQRRQELESMGNVREGIYERRGRLW